ncbi:MULTISPECIES: hypothetical protein [Shewanella]|uniref:Methyl-accepting chemotaxis protein n=1 Tax=Shewanella fidelis TaxID=173509 RepID=A0AAW8NI57_9GAMM|nr:MULTISPECIES: hypothetical protein [Shewanella]MDR8522201.1 hypothetical protein [Shewanella fidelis]MDW4812584.1 hypothetical protein [Shewanella fidelis]MDW4816332.1 hypothetical protein [Shewanella fidelis]MDW4820825.1 hypothetical protein [Shewanella fidelis]MDW4825048.1 hypothetical protein [Shewanella fidelis]
MLEFIRSNLKLIIMTTLFFVFILGGIYYVESALEAQVQVID